MDPRAEGLARLGFTIASVSRQRVGLSARHYGTTGAPGIPARPTELKVSAANGPIVLSPIGHPATTLGRYRCRRGAGYVKTVWRKAEGV